MDTNIEIKQEDPLSDDVDSKNEREFFTTDDTMQTNNIAMVMNDDCGVAIKTEVTSDTTFPNVCSQIENNYFTQHLIKCETVTTINNYDIDMKTEIKGKSVASDFGSQNESEILPEDPVMKDKKFNSGHEMNKKIEIKEEPWWLEEEGLSVCDDIKDSDFPEVNPARLNMELISGISHVNLPSAEVTGGDINSYNAKGPPKCESTDSDVTELPIVEQHVDSGHSADYRDGNIYNRALNYKQRKLTDKGETLHKCNNCDRSFKYVMCLKRHECIQCKTCDKCFTRLSDLKRHNLIHESKKPHQCKTCYKSFTQLSNLQSHSLVHEDKKPHQCKICNKSFTRLRDLKTHMLIHEGKKPHHCKLCDKRFTQRAHLKSHSLIHEGKKPYHCIICDKSFTTLSYLKIHNLIHEGKKAYHCKTCDKSFIQLSILKRHNLIHEGKPHQCKTCDKSFTRLSDLKRHTFVHNGEKPHQCKTCDKKFTLLSNLKIHNLIHEGKKPHQCKACDKSFTQLSNLKKHYLIH